MKKLPEIKTIPVSEERKRRLLRWFAMRKIENDIASVASDMDEQYDPRVRIPKGKSLVRPFDNFVEVGQIRLMNPMYVPTLNRPLYYAVLKEWHDDYMLIAPFSTFSEPATTGEMLTGIKHFSLSVLQLWNARTVPLHLIESGWLVSKLDENVLQDALSLFSHICGGESIAADLREKIGLPILHSDDPRIEYQSEERAVFGKLETMISQYEETIEVSLPNENVPAILEFVRELKFAAAAEDEKKSRTKGLILPNNIISADGEELKLYLKNREHIKCFNDAVCLNFIPGAKLVNLIWDFSHVSQGKLKDGMPFIVLTAAKCEKIAAGIIHECESCFTGKITRIMKEQELSIKSIDEIFMIVFE